MSDVWEFEDPSTSSLLKGNTITQSINHSFSYKMLSRCWMCSQETFLRNKTEGCPL